MNSEHLPAKSDEKLINKKELAAFLKCTPRTVEHYMSAGMVPYIKLGRTVRFALDDVKAHLNASFRVANSVR